MAREIGDIQVKIYAYKQRIKELKEELKKSLSKKIWALKTAQDYKQTKVKQ